MERAKQRRRKGDRKLSERERRESERARARDRIRKEAGAKVR